MMSRCSFPDEVAYQVHHLKHDALGFVVFRSNLNVRLVWSETRELDVDSHAGPGGRLEVHDAVYELPLVDGESTALEGCRNDLIHGSQGFANFGTDPGIVRSIGSRVKWSRLAGRECDACGKEQGTQAMSHEMSSMSATYSG